MYASVSTAEVLPGKEDEFVNTWRDSVKPLVEKFPGYKNIYVLTNKKLHKCMSIAIYETEADAERTQSSGDYRKVVEILASTIDMKSVVREGYDVGFQA